jgi:hypothetical protein
MTEAFDALERQGPITVNPATTSDAALPEAVACASCGRADRLMGEVAESVSPAVWGKPVYAVGRLSPQFPSIGVEKGFSQFTAGAHQGGQADVELLQGVLARPEATYLGRYLCWAFASEGLDIFHVLPRDDAEVARLAEVLSPTDTEDVVHVVVGKTAPSPADSPCTASGLPTVQADRVLAFTLQEFAAALPGPEAAGDTQDGKPAPGADRAEFEAVVRGVFARLTRRADNQGLTPEHIACNYLACEYPAFYHAVHQAQRDGKVLVRIDSRHRHAANRNVVAVRVAFRHPRTDITEQLQCLVDSTEPAFPFLITGLRPVFG